LTAFFLQPPAEYRLLSSVISLYFYYLLFSLLSISSLFLLAQNSNAVKMWSKKEAVAYYNHGYL